jgi:hypothetical protein
MIAFMLFAVAMAPAPKPATTPPPEDDVRWIEMAKPVRGMWEVGTFAGALIVARPHDFYDKSLG